MRSNDPLLRLLIEFFDLPEHTTPANMAQKLIPAWDSMAMVQLITEMQGQFGIEFDLDEIEFLRSYDEIRVALLKKNVKGLIEPEKQGHSSLPQNASGK